MHQLVYNSRLQPEIDWAAIVAIAEQARCNNEVLNVTGILVTYQHQVLQIIEGKHDTLSELYLRIANDPRHSQVQLLTFEAITKRNFSNWKMKEIAIERLPDDIQSTLSLLMPIEDNHRQLPTEANKAEALLTLIAAITSER